MPLKTSLRNRLAKEDLSAPSSAALASAVSVDRHTLVERADFQPISVPMAGRSVTVGVLRKTHTRTGF